MTDMNPAIAVTENWLENFVVKHNLCPFAAKPLKENRVRFVCELGDDEVTVVELLYTEIQLLMHSDPSEIETIIIVTPNLFDDFMEYNQFLNVIDSLINKIGAEGIVQAASFHPHYQFADLDLDDVRNYTNRSPYPMIHLLREDSIEKAANMLDVESIPHKNMALLTELGIENVKKNWTCI